MKIFWLIEQIICPPGPLNRERCFALFGHVVLWLVRLKITPSEVRKRDVGVLLDYQYSVGFISSEYFDYEQNLLFQTMIILIKKLWTCTQKLFLCEL